MKRVITFGLLLTALSFGLSGCFNKNNSEPKKKKETKKVVRMHKELVEENKA